MPVLIADCETTGVSADAEICELAFIEIDDDLTVRNEFQSLVKPTTPIEPAASAASHITNAMVADAPALADVLTRFVPSYFQDVTLIAHNCVFDKRMLAPHWQINKTLCTLQTARRLWPNAPNHKLQTLRYWLDLAVEGGAHRAMVDVITTYELLVHILHESSLSLQELIAEDSKPVVVTHMTFGKHKGELLTSLPAKYVQWLLGLENLDNSLRAALEEL